MANCSPSRRYPISRSALAISRNSLVSARGPIWRTRCPRGTMRKKEACPQMAAYLEFFVRSQDGLGIFVRDYAPEGTPRSCPVICLHGLTRNSADFETVAPRLAALGRRVIVPDMRGRGRSDWDPQPGRYRPDVYVQDVLSILDAARIDQAAFVGTSMGG